MKNNTIQDKIKDLEVVEFNGSTGYFFTGVIRDNKKRVEYPFGVSLYNKIYSNGVVYFTINTINFKQNTMEEPDVFITPFLTPITNEALSITVTSTIKNYIDSNENINSNIGNADLSFGRYDPFARPVGFPTMNYNSLSDSPLVDEKDIMRIKNSKYLEMEEDNKAFFIIDSDNDSINEEYWYDEGVDTIIIYKRRSKNIVILCNPKCVHNFKYTNVFEGVEFKRETSDSSTFISAKEITVDEHTALEIYQNIEKYISINRIEE